MDGPQLIRRPLVLCATFFCVGALFAPATKLLPDVIACVVLVFIVFRLARRQRVLSGILLPLPFFFAGLINATVRLPEPETLSEVLKSDFSDRAVVVEGIVAEAPRMAPDYVRLVVDAVGTSTSPVMPLVPARGRVDVWMPADGGPPCGRPGDRVRFWGRLSTPLPALMPGRDSGRVIAGRRGIALYGAVPSRRHCVRIRSAEVWGVRTTMERFRSGLHAAIDRALPPDRAAVVRAFATGDRTAISRPVNDAFVRSGLSHLLAVSGLNLAIVSGLFVIVLGAIFRRFERITLGIGALRLASLCAIPFVILYTLLVGASPSAVRAALMVLALLGAHIFGRIVDPWSALAVAVLLMVAWDPTTLGDVSFQLSFAAVAALFRVYPALRETLVPRLSTWPAYRRWAIEVALASMAATIGTAPLVARHFSRVSLVGLVSNIPAAPLGSLILVPLSLFGGVLASINAALGQVPLLIAGWASDVLVAIAQFSASVPAASFGVPKPTVAEVLLFYAVTIGFSLRPKTARSKRLTRLSFVALVLTATILSLQPRLTSKTRVAFVPVGQGDAIVIEMPKGKVVVVDTGPQGRSVSAAQRVLVPYLRMRRIGRVDDLIITHPHADHAGGIAELRKQIDVERIWYNGDRRSLDEALMEPLLRHGRVMTSSTAPITSGNAKIEVLGPVRAASDYERVNDGSIVLRLSQGNSAMILAGDAEAEAEAELVRRHGEKRLRAQVLKAGHHCSRTSSTDAFLAVVRPEHVVCTVGRNNRFGFPSRDVVERLRRRGVEMWRTDTNGVVVVEMDDGGVRVEPFRRP